jgi:hypothetical protein
MMQMKVLAVAALIAGAILSQPAAARPNDGSMWSAAEHESVVAIPGASKRKAAHRSHRKARSYASRDFGGYSGGAGPRPRRWCGWWMRTQKGGGAHLNVAWNWSRWGSPTGPQVGAVVVWRHHVGMITGRAADGRWIVTSGNDGGRVRSRARSVAGAVFRI